MYSKEKGLTSPYRKYPMLLASILIASSIIRAPIVQAESITDPMLVYKSPTCGCCAAWVKHMTDSGFNTLVKHPSNISQIKKQLHIAPKNQACHTAVLQNYVFEGHIPAQVIQNFLKHKPTSALGLAVPNMPMGSPGMDNGKAFNPYQVYLLNKNGSRLPYARVSAEKIIYVEQGS